MQGQLNCVSGNRDAVSSGLANYSWGAGSQKAWLQSLPHRMSLPFSGLHLLICYITQKGVETEGTSSTDCKLGMPSRAKQTTWWRKWPGGHWGKTGGVHAPAEGSSCDSASTTNPMLCRVSSQKCRILCAMSPLLHVGHSFHILTRCSQVRTSRALIHSMGEKLVTSNLAECKAHPLPSS